MSQRSFADLLADLNARIIAAEKERDRLSGDLAEARAVLQTVLADGVSPDAAAERKRAVEAALAIEDERIAGLRSKRVATAAEAAQAAAEDRWDAFKRVADRRVALAETIEGAIATLGNAFGELERISVAARPILEKSHKTIDIAEERSAFDNSMIRAGILWPYPNAAWLPTHHLGLRDRIANHNKAVLTGWGRAAEQIQRDAVVGQPSPESYVGQPPAAPNVGNRHGDNPGHQGNG